eukprot:symbB.v1.2.027327.t1/scaffold2762.1/size141425/4
MSGEQAAEESNSEGLHHHGAESSQAGYTLAELLLLSRSSSTPQRAAAMTVLGQVLMRARIPAPQDVLSADAAINRTGLYDQVSPSAPWRAGFGLGLQVFFWHVLARSDVPKHLAEALADPAQPVQLAALRATAELLGGVAEGEVCGDILRSATSPMPKVCCSSVEAALARPWDAARSLVWPSAPPGRADVLAHGTVAVLAAEGFGGQGGAKDEPEVTAMEVLEPLLPVGEMPSLGRLPPQISDEKQLALLARALANAAVLRPELCARLLQEEHRALWITAAESASTEAQLEVLRFIRMSCEVVGRGAVAWWLREEESKLLAALRRNVLSPLKGGGSTCEALCGVEALRCWISFLRCGAGCDRLESFAAEIGTYWHRFAVQDLDDEVAESHFLLTAHLLELTLEVFRLRHTEEEENPNSEGPCGRRGCPETMDWWVLMHQERLITFVSLQMVEAPVMAGSRSAATSPAQSPSRAYARLQQKAQALAADLDSKLSVALKARQALPAPSWRPEDTSTVHQSDQSALGPFRHVQEVPKRQSLPPGAVPLKAVLESEATPPAEVPKQPKQPTQPVPSPANHTPRIQALESRLEELVEKLQLEQSARKGFEQDLQKKLQVSADSAVQKALEANGGNARALARILVEETCKSQPWCSTHRLSAQTCFAERPTDLSPGAVGAMLPKWAFSLILFAVAVLGAMVAKLAQRRGGKAMMLAEAFVSGGLINAALVHLLAENMEALEHHCVVGHKAPEMRNVVSTNSPSDEENQSQLPQQLAKKEEADHWSVLLSISAGTFLYIGLVETMPGVRQPWLPTIMGRMAQMSVPWQKG